MRNPAHLFPYKIDKAAHNHIIPKKSSTNPPWRKEDGTPDIQRIRPEKFCPTPKVASKLIGPPKIRILLSLIAKDTTLQTFSKLDLE